jgi:RNA polymerase sigma factor (sigma-70 family)
MVSMVQPSSLTERSWDELFDFLDPNRHEKQGTDRDRDAEAKCREITRKLICFFASRGCRDAEDLALETTIRVAGKCADLTGDNYNDRMAYFYGVARNVLHEWQRDSRRDWTHRESVSRDPTLFPLANPQEWKQKEAAHRCLEHCMTTLTQRARRLILTYYGSEKAAKIEGHRKLADEFGKSANALRIEVHRIRKTLRRCVIGCLHPAADGLSGSAFRS